MKLNVNKCKVMRVTRSTNQSNPPSYLLNCSPLSSVSTYKYLGVHITSNLSWQTHIEYIANNANRMLGFLRRNFSLAPISLKLLLYNTLVRSKIEYASSVWDPHINSLVLILESIQNRSARFILSNYSRLASVSQMKQTLNLPDLSIRRRISRLCLFHKIYFTNDSLCQSLFTAPFYVSSRSDHRFKVGVPSCRTNLYFDSFVPKTSVDWNHLPASVVSISDHITFKSAVFHHLTS